jgi:phosphoribosyl-AMP cyclohydrolase
MPESATALVNGLRFDDNGLIPAVVQDHRDATVLMVAWMDAEAVRRTLTTGRTWFWSRSRQDYWCKGESSGHRQYVRSVHTDCDADTLLVRVEQIGAACHNGTRSCFTFELPAVAGSAAAATGQGAAGAGAHDGGTAALARADDSGGGR